MAAAKRAKKPTDPDSRTQWVRYMGLGMQIVATIGLGIGLGWFLDSRLATERPWFTLGLGLLGIVAALRQLFKDFG
jgi:F0F1-type ATP synthase assembly protein I